MGLNEALLSLSGLSLGDAFGQSFLFPEAKILIAQRKLPPAPWHWTDNTHFALSVVDELCQRGWVDQDSLAHRMARRYQADPKRGYSPQTRQTLERIAQGEYFRSVARAVFDGGSYGSSAAPRAIPLGGFYANDPFLAAREARLTASITHLHPEGVAGAQAVAAAASIAAAENPPTGASFLREVIRFVPDCLLKERITRAMDVPPDDPTQAIWQFNVNDDATVFSSVPFSLWCAAHHLDNFAEALWLVISGQGTCDANGAIVGGIVALAAHRLPEEWLRCRESLPIEYRIESNQLVSPEPFFPPGVPLSTGSFSQRPQGELSPRSIHQDSLTGLPNILRLLDYVDKVATTEPFTPFCLLAIHLVGLWKLNRELGRTAGDELLRSCTVTLLNHAPGLVFRAGGDKFLIYLNENNVSQVNELLRWLEAASGMDFFRLQRIRPTRNALIHFPTRELATSGNVLACLYMALSDHHFKDNDGLPRSFDASDVRAADDFPWMMIDLADQILRMGATAEESIRLAHTDSISQLPNMRAAMSALDTMISGKCEYHQSLAILMIDGDNLRRFNQISYEAGDEAIRLLGNTLKTQLRETDFIARWRTGDEFLVLLPDTDSSRAIRIGHRLCRAVEHASKSWLFPSTISIGIALYPQHGPTVQDVLHAAEQGLEKAKQTGKNQVCLSEEYCS